jgi:hypothetical protein
MQNRPARARSRLARLMDRPRAECDTIINFASPSATSPDFELPIKLRFRRQILVCCPRERFEIPNTPAETMSRFFILGASLPLRIDVGRIDCISGAAHGAKPSCSNCFHPEHHRQRCRSGTKVGGLSAGEEWIRTFSSARDS